MNILLNLLLISVGFISFIPVFKLFNIKNNKKYNCLRYLIFTTFLWTIITLIERLIQTGGFVYYAHMFSYPVKFALGGLMFCTVFNYIERKVPLYLIGIFFILFLGELFIAITNSSLQLLIALPFDDFAVIDDLLLADKGSLFIYHLIITYIILLSSVVLLFVFLSKNKEIVQYKEVTRTMAISVVFVLIINLSQLLFIETTIDLTYISLVIVVFALYNTIYTKDMVFNLRTSGRGEILSNMREMYIITNEQKQIVEISNLLVTKYNLTTNYINRPLEELYKDLEEYVVFYSDINVKNTESSDKDHLHIREKKFNLKGMNQFGYMVLLYDETQVFHLLRELNRLSNFDTMTGLNNRNYIETLLDSIKNAKGIGVISLDLNGLKINNDYLGHERGDLLLKRLSTIMKIVTKDLDRKEMARIGGDEFMILTFDIDESKIQSIVDNIMKEGFNSSVQDAVSVSVGYACGTTKKANVFTLIQEADEKMYEMKKDLSTKYKEQMILYLEKMGKFIR